MALAIRSIDDGGKGTGPLVTVTGAAELSDTLKWLGPRITNRLARRSMRRAARPIRDIARAKAPRDTGRLRKAIKVVSMKKSVKGDAQFLGKNDIGAKVVVRETVKTLASSSRAKGGIDRMVVARWVELGQKNRPGYPKQPFLGPAAEAGKSAVIQVWKHEMKKAVHEEAAKAQRKAPKVDRGSTVRRVSAASVSRALSTSG